MIINNITDRTNSTSCITSSNYEKSIDKLAPIPSKITYNKIDTTFTTNLYRYTYNINPVSNDYDIPSENNKKVYKAKLKHKYVIPEIIDDSSLNNIETPKSLNDNKSEIDINDIINTYAGRLIDDMEKWL